MPCQSEERKARYASMEEHECMDAMQVVLPNGDVFAGDKALPHVLLRLKRWHWLAHVFSIPGVTLLAPIAYGLIARNRYALSTLIARKGERAACDTDSACEP